MASKSKMIDVSQARKGHININLLVRLLLGHPGNVPGTNRACPRDKVGLSQGQTQVFFLFYTAEASLSLGQTQFVPGTFRGRRAADRAYVLKVYVPFSFPSFRQELPKNLLRPFRRNHLARTKSNLQHRWAKTRVLKTDTCSNLKRLF